MKKFSLLISIFIFSAIAAFSQNIAYILPDIGSPGMNTYVEIVSHADSVGTYGPDKTYFGLPGDDLKIVFENPNDTNDVVVGPLVVSWDGRLISTQIFVNPNVKPNDWDWENLQPQFKKRISVKYLGKQTNYQDFYIVNPMPLGNVVSNPERILGEGTLGKRSPRGAMLVDSLILADDRYFPSIADCDPNTPGNQAYLPFILMAKFKIQGAVNTIIDMRGGAIRSGIAAQDAGPGGGGGGGAFEDVNTNRSSGKRAGNGFTCGGFGGSNTYLNSGTGYWVDIDLSRSTSVDGASLNAVKGGETKTFCAECSGGGTGHPFGKSGEGSDGQNDQSKIGYYGGGSGYSNDQNGGSAGYGKAGTGLGNTGGKVHGNVMIVPLAGGSGGASGNPQPELVENEWSGSGGGGGGAIRLYAREIIGLDIPAIGGSGESADDAEGGNGSGGAIELSANSRLEDIITNVSGFARHGYYGGAGYVKINAANQSSIVDNTGGGLPIYNSVSTDSLQYVPRIFTLTGTKGSGKNVILMFKIGHEPWRNVTSFATLNNADWSIDFNLTAYKSEKVFYFYAIQEETGVGANQYLNIPEGVLSQSAANIFMMVDEPLIDGDEHVYMTVNACPGNNETADAYLWSESTVPLDLNFSASTFVKNVSGLELVSPTTDISLPDYQDSIKVQFKYTYQPGVKGPIYDTLLVPHNDNSPGKPKPWRIAVTIFINEYDYTIIDDDGKTIDFNSGDEVHLGSICRGGFAEKRFYMNNNQDMPLTFVNFGFAPGNKGFWYVVEAPGPIDRDERASILVKYDDNTFQLPGSEVKDTIYFQLAGCPSITDSVVVSVDFLYSTLSLVNGLDFGAVRVGETATRTATIENIGNADVYILNLPTVSAPFSIKSYDPFPTPVSLKPGETMNITIEYSPTTEADDSGTILVESQPNTNACETSINIPVSASSYQSAIELSKNDINFGIVPECKSPEDTIYLKNNISASGNVNISVDPEITGTDAGFFELKKSPSVPFSIAPGDSVEYIVEFQAFKTPAGNYNAELKIRTDEPNIDSLIIITLTAETDNFDISFDNISNPYTTIVTGKKYDGIIEITNNSKSPRNAFNIVAYHPEATINPNSYLFAPGETKQFDFSITYTDTLDLSFDISVQCDTPCLDSVQTTIEMDVIYGLADVDLALDLGQMAPCNLRSDTVFVRNIGEADIELRDINLSNNSFAIIEEPTVPLTIAPSDSSFVIVEFDANAQVDGIYNTNLNFVIYEYGQEITHTTTLDAERKSVVLATPNSIDFGNVIEGYDSDKIQLTISNTGTYDLEILEVIFPTGNNFELHYEELFSNGSAVNYPLPVGDDIAYNLTFIPNQIDTFSGEILIVIQYSDCVDTLAVPYSAEGVPDNILTLTLPQMLVDPAAPSVTIPLQASTSKFEITTKLDSLTIVYDRNVMKILGIDNASYQLYQTLDTLTIVFQDSTIYTIDQEFKTILNIYAMPLLGHIESTDMIISYLPKAGEKISGVIENDGKITLDICKEGGDRLLLQSNRTDISIEPNPASNVIKVRAFLLEVGQYSLEIYDLSGKRIYEKSIENTIFAGTEKTLDISTENIGSGEYMMMLVAPSQTISKKVVVLK